jgi:FAD/FMN-containing dehydrogenase
MTSILLDAIVLTGTSAIAFEWYRWYKSGSDFAGVYRASNMEHYRPKNKKELIHFLKFARAQHPPRPLSLLGNGYSHGGHTIVDDGTQINLKNLKYIYYNFNSKSVYAEAGATWADVLQVIVRYGRCVHEMPSCLNFTVGGSISVNAHGRGLLVGALSESIVSMHVLVPISDQVLEVFPEGQHSELFRAIVGGYGLFAIIISATLKTIPDNTISLEILKTESAQSTMAQIYRVIADPSVAYYNGNIHRAKEEECVHFIWRNDPHEFERIEEKPVGLLRRSIWRVRPVDHLKRSEMILSEPDANESATTFCFPQTTILQEYFVPLNRGEVFLKYLLARVKEARLGPEEKNINVLKINIRIVKSIEHSLLNYAPVDSISICLYICQWNMESELKILRRWTKTNIKKVIRLGGNYYMPYLLLYSPAVFAQMYPKDEMLALKRKYDPTGLLQNIWSQHIGCMHDHDLFASSPSRVSAAEVSVAPLFPLTTSAEPAAVRPE